MFLNSLTKEGNRNTHPKTLSPPSVLVLVLLWLRLGISLGSGIVLLKLHLGTRLGLGIVFSYVQE